MPESDATVGVDDQEIAVGKFACSASRSSSFVAPVDRDPSMRAVQNHQQKALGHATCLDQSQPAAEPLAESDDQKELLLHLQPVRRAWERSPRGTK